jgi:hypothetical protein
MVALTISGDQMIRLEKAVGQIKDGVPKALAAAINRTLNKGRTEVKRAIRQDYLIKAKDIPAKVRGVNPTRLYNGQLFIKDTMLDLNKFPFRPRTVQRRKNKKMLFVQVKTTGGKLMPHAFVAAMPSGYVGPFERRDKPSLPIDKLMAIATAIMASQPHVMTTVRKAMDETLDTAIGQQINRAMARVNKK